MRRLLVTIRTIRQDHGGDYETAWGRLHALVTGRGANAWRFRHDRDAGRYIEFVEWKGATDPTAGDAGIAAMKALDAIAPGATDLWIDAEATK